MHCRRNWQFRPSRWLSCPQGLLQRVMLRSEHADKIASNVPSPCSNPFPSEPMLLAHTAGSTRQFANRGEHLADASRISSLLQWHSQRGCQSSRGMPRTSRAWSLWFRSSPSNRFNRTGAPDRPDHQDWLEEQAHESCSVGIQPECVGARDELRDVPGENHHEERRHDPADRGAKALRAEDERGAQDELDHTGDRDHCFGRWHPRRNLGEERVGVREMAEPSTDQEGTEDDPTDGSQHALRMPRHLRLVFTGALERRSAQYRHHRPRRPWQNHAG